MAKIDVAPLAGAWIEIGYMHSADSGAPSLPSRERGLKYNLDCDTYKQGRVAPLAGAWIEICGRGLYGNNYKSLPSRERGLKY